MKQFFLLLCIVIVGDLNAQVISVDRGFFGVSLYNENGDRLTRPEIEALAEYGFNVDVYKTVQKKLFIADTFICVSSAALLYSTCRKPFLKKNLEDDPMAKAIMYPSCVIFFISGFLYKRFQQQIEKEVDVVNKRFIIQPSSEGIGLSFAF